MEAKPIGKQEPIKRFRSQGLEAELEQLKKFSGLGLELKVLWKPSADGKLSGEVKNNLLYVYEVDKEKAVDTLRHEFLDYCVSQAIEPYKEVTNRLIRMINEEAYSQKENIIEALTKLIYSEKPGRLEAPHLLLDKYSFGLYQLEMKET